MFTEFDPSWVMGGLDGDPLKNLLTEDDSQAIKDPGAYLDRFRGPMDLVDPLREGGPLRAAVPAAQLCLRQAGISCPKDKAMGVVNALESYCGDDEIGISDNPFYLALKREIYPIVGMQVSQVDTAFNYRYGNYAEDLIILPETYYNTYETTRKSGFHEDMAFIDMPKLRLNIFVSPMRPDHSGTVDGKSSMMGARVAWTPERSPFRWLNELASLHQDAVLGLCRAKKPAYLPVQLGGMGKPPAFRNPLNWRNYFLAWKQGTRFEYTNHVISMLDRYLERRSSGAKITAPPLLKNLVRFNTQFHDWIKSRSVYSPQFWLDRPDWATEYIVDFFGISEDVDSALSRGIKEGEFISEENLLVHAEHAEQCDALLSAPSWTEFIRQKDEIVAEWRRLSVYGQASLGQIQEVKPDFKNYSPVFDHLAVARVYAFLAKRGRDLKSLVATTPVYRQEVIDRLYDRSVMRVGITLTPTKWASSSTFIVEPDLVNARDVKRRRELLDWVLKPREDRGDPPMDLIEDDHVIIRQVVRNARIIPVIVTDDLAMCRKIDRLHGVPVFRVPVWWYHRYQYFDKWELEDPDIDPPWIDNLRKLFPEYTFEEKVDTGAVEALEEKNYYNGSFSTSPIRSRIVPKASGKRGMKPFTKPILGENGLDVRVVFPLLENCYDSRNYLKLRNKLHRRAG